MIDYGLIKNTTLRTLVIASESIHRQQQTQIEDMVRQLAALPSDGQPYVIKILRDEQAQISEAREAKGITPEMELAEIEEKSIKLQGIKNKFEKTVREVEEGEAHVKEESKMEARMDDMINDINI